MHALETDYPHAAPRDARFEALYRREFAFVWAAARHLGVSTGAIDDVVQDVFFTAYRRLEDLRFEVSPRAWLFGVTRRVAFRYRRGAARRIRRHTAFAETGQAPSEAPQQRHDDAQQLERLLGRLSAVTREVWQMTELLGMTAPEIASELGLPINTVYSRLRLAREQLRTLVAEATVEAWRAEARRDHAPPEGAPQRTWALMLPVLGERGGGVGVLAWVKAQAAMTTTIAAGVVALGIVVRAGAPAEPARTLPAARVEERSTPSPTSVAPSLPPVSEPAVVPMPAPVRRLPARTAASTVDAQARLAEEVALIDRAHAQLARAEPDAALATIAAHAQRFPDGALVDVREAALAEALCRRGDVDAAEASARRLVIDHPASVVAQRFANYRCTR